MHRLQRIPRDTNTNENSTAVPSQIRIYGIRIEGSVTFNDDGVPELTTDTQITLRLFGEGFNASTLVALTEKPNTYGSSCYSKTSGEFLVRDHSVTSDAKTVLVDITMPKGSSYFYLCTRYAEENGGVSIYI